MAVTMTAIGRNNLLACFPGIANRISPKPVITQQPENRNKAEALHTAATPIQTDLHSGTPGAFEIVMAALQEPKQLAQLITSNKEDILSHLNPHGYNAYTLLKEAVQFPSSLRQLINLIKPKPDLLKFLKEVVEGNGEELAGLIYNAREIPESLKQLIKLDPEAAKRVTVRKIELVSGTTRFKTTVQEMIENPLSKRLLEDLMSKPAA